MMKYKLYITDAETNKVVAYWWFDGDGDIEELIRKIDLKIEEDFKLEKASGI
jgi:hypothetical protein